MTVDTVVQISNQALFLVIKTAAPVLLISLVVGLLVSVFQTVTSIQEQTLTFVPKIVSIFLTLMILGHWMLDNMAGFIVDLWSDFSVYIR